MSSFLTRLPHRKRWLKKWDSLLRAVKAKVDSLEEFNPMLGHRGCRPGITYPEITEMQTRAIIEAALNCKSAA